MLIFFYLAICLAIYLAISDGSTINGTINAGNGFVRAVKRKNGQRDGLGENRAQIAPDASATLTHTRASATLTHTRASAA